MKKFLILLLTLVLAASCLFLLASCGEGDPVPTPNPDTDLPTSYTVSFTGEGVSTPDQTVQVGATAIRPKDPTRVGYEFTGWLRQDGTLYDFTQIVTANLTLTAGWHIADTEILTGSGTKDDPYLIFNAKQLVTFATRVNDPASEEDPDFAASYFRLEADIDMTGVKYTPAGKTVVLYEGTENEKTVPGFGGDFDGNGHTISHLTIDRTVRAIGYIGLFGETYMAKINDLILSDYAYSVSSFSTDTGVGAYVGGVAAFATLTEFRNVRTTGVVTTNVMTENTLYIGGLAGRLDTNSRDSQVYISYTENCYADIEICIGDNEDGLSTLQGAVSGGLFGYIYNYSGAVAIINSMSAGQVVGGSYVGGLVGDISGSNTSIQSCVSTAKVTATSKSVTYAGGIVGASFGDNLIKDCLATGRVSGVAGSSTYKSYSGKILGYGSSDDFSYGIEYGTAVVNCYSSGSIGGTADKQNPLGTTAIAASEINRAWVLSTLFFDGESWNFDETTGRPASPTAVTAGEVHPTIRVTLASGGATVGVLDRNVTDSSYSLMGNPDRLANRAPNLFWQWEITEGNPVRYYAPVIRDITITASWKDATDIAAKYSGTATLHESIDAGIIILRDNGELEWIRSGVLTGSYLYDGTHILITLDAGDVMGGTVGNNTLAFTQDAGMSGTVQYSMAVCDIRFVGEYFSPTGDIITFGSEGNVSFQSYAIRNGDYTSANYTVSGNTLTLTSKLLGDLYSSMTIVCNEEDNELTVTFVPSGTNTYALNAVKFTRLGTRDYTGMGFVDTFNCTMPSWTYTGQPTQSDYLLIFRADGTAIYRSAFSDQIARYYYFADTHTVKLLLEGLVSTLTYDEDGNFFYGNFNRGLYSNPSVVITPASDGALRCFMNGSASDSVYVTDNGFYRFVNGQYVPGSVIAGDFTDGSRVTIDGVAYIALYSKEGSYSNGYQLKVVGAEEGTYTYTGSSTLTLDGIGNVSGAKNGIYLVYGDLIVIYDDSDDTLFGFDYPAAQTAGNVITEKKPDKYQGVWYIDQNKIDDNGDDYLFKKFYKWLVDGYGHTTMLYYSLDESEYHFNWTSAWGTYTESATGVSCQFNSMQDADVRFYYNNGLAYSNHFGYLGEIALYADGYTGAMIPPALPAGVAGSYTGTTSDSRTVILNLNSDITGTFEGNPFIGVYDGANHVYFTLQETQYEFEIVNLTLTVVGADSVIQMTAAGAVVDVIPAAIAGTWSGLFSGYGTTTNDTRTVIIETNGTVRYNGTALANVQYTATEYKITATMDSNDNSWVVTMIYDPEDGTMSYLMKETTEFYELTATLSK